jgi:hypothetical protein
MESKIIQTKGFFELEAKYGTHVGDSVRLLIEIDFEKKSVHIKPKFGGDNFTFKHTHAKLEKWTAIGGLISTASDFAKKELEIYEAALVRQEEKKQESTELLEFLEGQSMPVRGKYLGIWHGRDIEFINEIPAVEMFSKFTLSCNKHTDKPQRVEIIISELGIAVIGVFEESDKLQLENFDLPVGVYDGTWSERKVKIHHTVPPEDNFVPRVFDCNQSPAAPRKIRLNVLKKDYYEVTVF